MPRYLANSFTAVVLQRLLPLGRRSHSHTRVHPVAGAAINTRACTPWQALLVTAGRPGVDLFVSADGFGRSWERYSLPTFHNRLVDTQHEEQEWKFCAAYEEAAANHTFQVSLSLSLSLSLSVSL